jgi:hypothetical protein
MKRLVCLAFALAAAAGSVLACSQDATPTALPSPTSGPTPTPLPLQSSQWEGTTIRSVCLAVEQSYPEIEGDFSLPIESSIRNILGALGLQMVQEQSACDASLRVMLEGEPLGDHYISSGVCYTGARVSGKMELSSSGRSSLEIPFLEEQLPPAVVSSCPEQRAYAPFGPVWGRAVVKALMELWGMPVAVAALQDDVGSVQAAGAEELGKLGAQAADAVPLLAELVWEGAENARRAAIEALGQIGPAASDALGELIGVLRFRSNSYERGLAAEAMGRIGVANGETISVLLDALADDSISLREEAARALGAFGPQALRAVPALIEALGDRFPAVVQAAGEALAACTGQQFGTDAVAWQQWWTESQAGGN